MSGNLKQGAHEEGGHTSSTSVRPNYGGEEENHAYPRVNYGTAAQDTMPGILPRPDSRDGERRVSLTPEMYRLPPLGEGRSSHGGHTAAGPEVEARPEVREVKDSRESKGVESNRDVKVEVREGQSQSGKVEKEGRVESRMDEGKDVKHERERGNDLKGEVKGEKDVYGWGASYPNWKEQSRGKRLVGYGNTEYVPPPKVKRPIIPNWPPPSQYYGKLDAGKPEAAKQGVIGSVVKDRVEGNEAVGENRVDLKADDKYKDRKQKDGKHYDGPDSDKDRSDHRSNLLAGCSNNNDVKEALKDEREPERLERERKDLPKEKEGSKEREKDHGDKGGRSGGEKESYQNEKDVADKPLVQENIASGSKKQTDSWRNLEREAKERRKEREGDVEGERPEKRRCYEKELDEGPADVDGGTDKERDTFGYGVQQKKRMLRPRGSPQVPNRDACFKSRGQDAEGCQGKPEVSTVYKVGECLQELTKLWTDYDSSLGDNRADNLYKGPTVEIRIPAEHVTATNRQVRGGQLWGTDIYTNDSDLVAVLMHTGYCRPTASPPPAAIQELRATIRVLPPQESYVSTLRNNVRSRAWGSAIGSSYRVERCCIMKRGGGTIDLEPSLTHTSAIEPTLAPVAVERTMTTRAAASNALRQQRFVREVTIQYNLCNEPWIKYSISIVADKGLKKPLFTSARLKKGEVLYVETHTCRYELCFTCEKIVKSPSMTQIHEADEKSQNHASSVNGDRNMTDVDNNHSVVVDMFRWSRCKKPLPQKVMRSIGIPLPLDHVEVLEENLDWEDVQWSQTGVWIGGKEYPLARVHFLSPN